MTFDLVQMVYWLCVAGWFGVVLFAAMATPVIFRTIEEADPTSGMVRERAFELPVLWAGKVTTAPGAVSGWHHHDVNESSLYVVSGVLRLEFEGHFTTPELLRRAFLQGLGKLLDRF